MNEAPSSGDALIPLTTGHVIEKLRLDAAFDREEGAGALLERIGELNRERLIPIIEAVLDEFDRARDTTSIGTIAVDLGRVGPDDLAVLDARLAEALRNALADAVSAQTDEAQARPSVPATVRPLEDSLADALEHWLLHGVWPYFSVLRAEIRPAQLIQRLLADAADALARALRCCGRSQTALSRLLLQTPEPLLHQLLPLLDPEPRRMTGEPLRCAPLVREDSLSENWLAAPERIAVPNAGLALAAPFLPQLFFRLGFMVPEGAGGRPSLSEAGKARAPHLLQWFVDGSCDRPEPLLALNKLLCGLPPGAVVPPAIDPNAEEVETCGALLEAMIASWPSMSGSSVAALRETFLQREGVLVATEGGWRLDVQRSNLDVLMDSLPWSIAMVFHPWMAEPLSVSW